MQNFQEEMEKSLKITVHQRGNPIHPIGAIEPPVFTRFTIYQFTNCPCHSVLKKRSKRVTPAQPNKKAKDDPDSGWFNRPTEIIDRQKGGKTLLPPNFSVKIDTTTMKTPPATN